MLKIDPNQSEFVDFYLPFSEKLKRSNRWVKLADLIPWDEVERCYAESLSGTGMGAPAKSGRIAYGSLILQERLGATDEEITAQIGENPYLQCFLGLEEFHDGALFDASLMVHFRARFRPEHHRRISERIIKEATAGKVSGQSDEAEPPANSGKLLVDASCAPADIKFPTDLGLLNQAREKSEQLIDQLHGHLRSKSGARKKPRSYRQNARRDYLSVAKQKRPGRKKIRKAIGKQLRYLRRNLGHIDGMLDCDALLLSLLSRSDYKRLLVIRTLYEQQLHMYETRSHKVPGRIVSISQPHVRPIVRGKANKDVEFGAKISISSQKEGYVSLDKISWDAYNESGDLTEQIEAYKNRFGYYPSSVHADAIYRTRENRNYCKQRGIRLSGKPLGRPRKATADNQQQLSAERAQQRQDERDRIPVEGKFGNAKRKGTLDRIMAKLSHTSETVIHIAITVLNLEKWLRAILLRPFHQLTTPRFPLCYSLALHFCQSSPREGNSQHPINANNPAAPRYRYP